MRSFTPKALYVCIDSSDFATEVSNRTCRPFRYAVSAPSVTSNNCNSGSCSELRHIRLSMQSGCVLYLICPSTCRCGTNLCNSEVHSPSSGRINISGNFLSLLFHTTLARVASQPSYMVIFGHVLRANESLGSHVDIHMLHERPNRARIATPLRG